MTQYKEIIKVCINENLENNKEICKEIDTVYNDAVRNTIFKKDSAVLDQLADYIQEYEDSLGEYEHGEAYACQQILDKLFMLQ